MQLSLASSSSPQVSSANVTGASDLPSVFISKNTLFVSMQKGCAHSSLRPTNSYNRRNRCVGPAASSCFACIVVPSAEKAADICSASSQYFIDDCQGDIIKRDAKKGGS